VSLSDCFASSAARGIEPVIVLSAVFVLDVDVVSGNMKSGNQLSEAFTVVAANITAAAKAVAKYRECGWSWGIKITSSLQRMRWFRY
jgi:uncharacterized hydantoinase/oxoprolinase family protein